MNSVNNQQNDFNNQVNGGTPAANTNHLNNISAVAANNTKTKTSVTPVSPVSSVSPTASVNNTTVSQGYVEPPKKKGSFGTFIIIFLILACAAIGGYFAGQYIYDVTHQNTTTTE